MGPGRVLAGLAVTAIVLAVVWAALPGRGTSAGRRTSGRPSPAAPASSGEPYRPIGILVYAANPDGRGREVLWTLDLSDGVALPGPRIPRATALTDASLAAPGWVGLTVPGQDGSLLAYVLGGTSPRDRPRLLGSGEMVAWAPRGDVVALGRREPPTAVRCAGARIDLVHVATGVVERALGRPALCGNLRALGRDITTTYLSMRTRTGIGTYAVGIDVAHPLLLGFQMQGVSPTSDFLVLPVDERGRRLRGLGTRLFWPGTGGPLAYGRPRDPLVVRRVLAWSQDGSRAAVLGRTRTLEGVFVLDTSAGGDPRRPAAYVGRAGRVTAATFARDGTLYVQADGLLRAYASGGQRVVALPSGAPPPIGPILWLP